ncbi:hypothetical protein Leryth_011082 [Lithospermum erythrorhizon]|nr:hypothetical protein Leryth_011082 [Lithospermum erythrorhizon]
MEEYQSSSGASRPTSSTPASRMKIGCISAATSFQETFRYVKALLIGQVKKLSAKNEEEATEADLLTAKMQVEAADAAENTKKQLHKYS